MSSVRTSPKGSPRRTGDGRFKKGNTGGPGNPHAKQVAQLRTALLEAVTPEDMKAVVDALVEKAKGGDVHAVKELLTRTLGKPIEPDLLERIERLEKLIESEKGGER